MQLPEKLASLSPMAAQMRTSRETPRKITALCGIEGFKGSSIEPQLYQETTASKKISQSASTTAVRPIQQPQRQNSGLEKLQV